MTHDHKPLLEQQHHHDGENVHHHHHRDTVKSRLGWVITLTGVMMVVEAIFGYFSGSLALISDAGHMLTHFGALLISLVAIYIARRPSQPSQSYGMYRVEILAALLNAIALLVITVFIFKEAVQRLLAPNPIATFEMFLVAIIGLIVNLISAALLWKVGSGDDLNIRSAFLHMLGDTASSVAVVIGAVVIKYTGALWLDPILSVLICMVILVWAYDLTRSSILILLEATPKSISLHQVEGVIKSVPGVGAVHDLHIWTITSGMHALTAHIEVSDQLLSILQEVRHDLESILREKFKISHTNLQFEVKKIKEG
ncbi:MAG: cation diffusion facilitator family transporter [bacterium]|nr:cation diffusion facilitator family transporter [bacterium]